MGFVNGEVVHALVGVLDELDAFDCAVIADQTLDQMSTRLL
jgi:hypothetical protein